MAVGSARVALAVLAAQLRDRPLRLLVNIAAIALGIALTAGIYLVNESALAEFARATRELVGSSDLVVRGGRGGFDERLYETLIARPEVRIASPVVELDVALARGGTLPVEGIDPFLAGQLQPAIYAELAGSVLALLEPDAIALSATAARTLKLRVGERLAVRVAGTERLLRVIAVLPESAYAARLGIMDIGVAQWTLGSLGRLQRIDLGLRPGIDAERFAGTVAWPAGVSASSPALENARASSLTRAYRVNLDMLALVALLTGAFLVFATQALSVLRRRQPLALMRALGVTRRELQTALVAEGILIGAVGGLLGTAGGWLIAGGVLALLGGDLGAGLLEGTTARVVLTPLTLGAFVGLGVFVAALSAWWPARQAARIAPARALKSGDETELVGARSGTRLALVLLAAGTACAFGPPVHGLPLFGYAAIALLLFGSVLLVPVVAALWLGLWPEGRAPVARLALAQLRGSVGQSAVSLAAIVVSFSLMVAMSVMVHSFRDSFERWLGQVLPADIYLRVAFGNDTDYVEPAAVARVRALPGIERAEFRRATQVAIAPGQPLVTIIARPLGDDAAGLPLLERVAATATEALPLAYASEAVRDLYGWQAGAQIELPIGGELRHFRLAGIWRDYARSNGSVVVDLAVFERVTGEQRYTEGSFWLAPGASAASVLPGLRAALGAGDSLQLVEVGDLKARSLSLFDRAFAITYALEAVAVAMGLAGVALAFGSQALARRGEFGMLRHLGLRRRDVEAMLAGQGAMVGAVGAVYGLVVGLGLSLVLVYVVNRQSFHWSLDFVVPALPQALVTLALVVAAALTARVSARLATGDAVLRAVREDW